MKKIILGIIAIITIIFIVLVVIAQAGVDIGIGGGYRVTVTGEVSYGPIAGWDCKYGSANYVPDPGLFSFQPMWIWDTDDIVVEIELTNGRTYTGEANIGKINKYLGGDKTFSVDVRHVPEGFYTGYINVYEVEKALFGLGWEKSRTLRVRDSFSIDIIGD